MSMQTFLRIQSAQSEQALKPYLESSNNTVQEYAAAKLCELQDGLFSLDEVV